MAKQGMKRYGWNGPDHEPETNAVPVLQGKAKTGKKKANPIIAGTSGSSQKVYHQRPISKAYPEIDTDLARDNLENDIPYADLQDL